MKNYLTFGILLLSSVLVFGQQTDGGRPIFQDPIYSPTFSVFMSYIDLCDDKKDIYLQILPTKGYDRETKNDIIPTRVEVLVGGERKTATLINGRYEVEIYNYTSSNNELDITVEGFDRSDQLVATKSDKMSLERDGMIRVSDHLYAELDNWRSNSKGTSRNNIIYHFCGVDVNKVELLAFFQEFLELSKEDMCTWIEIYETETFESFDQEYFHNVLVGILCDKFEEFVTTVRGGGGEEDECSCKIIKSATHVRHSDGNEYGVSGESTSENCPDITAPREGSHWWGDGSTWFDTHHQNDWGNTLWGWQGAAKMLTVHGHLTNHSSSLNNVSEKLGTLGDVSSSLSFSMYCYDPIELGPANDSDCLCTKDVSIGYRYSSKGYVKGEAWGFDAKFNGTMDDRAYFVLVNSSGEKFLHLGEFSMTIGCESTDTTTWIQDISSLGTAIENAAGISLGDISSAVSTASDLVIAVNQLDPFHGGCGVSTADGISLLDSTVIVQLTPDNHSVTATIGSVVEGVLNLENDNVDATMSLCSDYFMSGTLVTDQDSTSDNCCNELVGAYIIGDLGEFQNDNLGQPKFNGLFDSPTSLTFKQQLVAGHLLTSGGENFGILVFPDVVCCQPKVDCYYDCGYYGNCTNVDSSGVANSGETSLRSRNKSKYQQDSEITIYPTPILAGNNLKIETQSYIKIAKIQIFDMKGSLISTYKNFNNSGINEINLTGITSGMYVLKFETNLEYNIAKRILIK